MLSIVIAIFVVGYATIVFEHPLKLLKTVPTLLMGSLIWAVISMADLPVISHLEEIAPVSEVLLHHSGKIAEILFFLGILLAIGGLESVVANAAAENPVGLLRSLAERLGEVVPNESIVAVILGYLSAIIDNVPLVAAVMGMYPNPMDDALWHFIAYTAGTGGSMLIIGMTSRAKFLVTDDISS